MDSLKAITLGFCGGVLILSIVLMVLFPPWTDSLPVLFSGLLMTLVCKYTILEDLK